MDASQEQNKTEEPTPFKLKRAREKGAVARGIDLGFFSALAGVTLFLLAAGQNTALLLSQATLQTFATMPAAHDQVWRTLAAAGSFYWPVFQRILMLVGTLFLIVALFEVVQVRGIVVSAQPLKPDFSRLNPGKNLKRLFSVRMLKETLKGVVKMAAYSIAGFYVIKDAFEAHAQALPDSHALITQLRESGLKLLFVFVLLALGFSILDQVLARGEFHKQMRMSRRELTREVKEREGEPRLKQKRQQLHAEFAKQARSVANLKGADALIVNPEHFAVALRYDAKTMDAPRVKAKARNHFALLLKKRAAALSIPIISQPALARALYKACDTDAEIPEREYRAVAGIYLQLARLKGADHAQA